MYRSQQRLQKRSYSLSSFSRLIVRVCWSGPSASSAHRIRRFLSDLSFATTEDSIDLVASGGGIEVAAGSVDLAAVTLSKPEGQRSNFSNAATRRRSCIRSADLNAIPPSMQTDGARKRVRNCESSAFSFCSRAILLFFSSICALRRTDDRGVGAAAGALTVPVLVA